MPSFGSANSTTKTPEHLGGQSYTKIIAIVAKNGPSKSIAGIQGRVNKVSMGLRSDLSFESEIKNMPSGVYERTAGEDLSSIFYPYESVIGPNSDLPSFDSSVSGSGVGASGSASSGVTLESLLPFRWEKNNTGVYDRWAVPSGGIDSLKTLMSGPQYHGDTERYRHIDKIRGIGLRLPAMAVGWGYDTTGKPFPSGSGGPGGSGIVFKGGYASGYQVDPSHYVAAPIDLRYDRKRNVWTSPEAGFWAEITNMDSETISGVIVPYYSWVEKVPNPSGFMVKPRGHRSGTKLSWPGHEVNYNTTVTSGSHVWMVPDHETSSNLFFYPKEILPSGQYQWMSYVMVSQNQPGWDFIRAHSLL